MKLCECGCGQPTRPAKWTDKRRGTVRGQPRRFLTGHHRRGPRPAGPGTPPCNPRTLRGPVCRALDCQRPMHRWADTRCADGHPRHSGRGICHPCRARIARGTPVELAPVEAPRIRPDEVLEEWEFLRGTVSFHDFPARVGITAAAWDRMFYRAVKAGDPRAVRPKAAA